MKLTNTFTDAGWLEKVKQYDFMAVDRGTRVFEIIHNGQARLFRDGAEVRKEDAEEELLNEVAPGDEVREYAPFFRSDGNPARPVRDRLLIGSYSVESDRTPLTMKEKLQVLEGAGPDDIERIKGMVTDGEIFLDGERLGVRIDLRKRINEKLAREDVTRISVGRRIGKSKQYMTAYLNGRVPVPHISVEELLWLLEDGNMVWNDCGPDADSSRRPFTPEQDAEKKAFKAAKRAARKATEGRDDE